MSDLTAGRVLAQARADADVSLREIADALNLPISTLEAIERNASEELPAPVFTRGYVRAYAKYLEIDPEPLVAEYADAHQTNVESLAPTKSSSGRALALKKFAYRGPHAAAYMVGGAALVVLLVVAVWLFSSSNADGTTETIAPSSGAEEPIQSPPSQERLTLSTEPSQVDATVRQEDQTDPDFPLESQSEPAPEQASAAETAQETAQENQQARLAPANETVVTVGNDELRVQLRRLTESGEERLVLTFSDQCWVEIKDADNQTLYENLGRPGDQWQFVGRGPFQVLLGYATGASLAYNGEPIALVPHTRNNVARLVLGQ